MEMEMSNPSSTLLTCDLEQGHPLSPNTSTPPVADLKQELNTLCPLSPNNCICRVPKLLRGVNQKAYTPQLVSIGPLHHGQESLVAMENHKLRFVRDYYLRRSEKPLEYFENIIKIKEEELRSCYAERIELSSDEFVKIVVVDALFIIELFLKGAIRNEYDITQSNYIIDGPCMLKGIMHDLMLFENQLPFFILEELLCENSGRVRLSMTKLSQIFFYDTFDNESRNLFSVLNSFSKINHFVDLLIKFEVPTKPEAGERKNSRNLPKATKLHQSGIEFKVRKDKKLFDIQFLNGVLEIPKLRILDSTELKLRNLIAFEQCYQRELHASAYGVFMSSLVRTYKDFELLIGCGIIENFIGDSNGLATMKKLGDKVSLNGNFDLAEIFDKLNCHCETHWNKHRVTLKEKYFDSPWTAISVIAASMVIILTLIQTICSVISVVKG